MAKWFLKIYLEKVKFKKWLTLDSESVLSKNTNYSPFRMKSYEMDYSAATGGTI
jgi:hypothetical protein